ncbi:MAG: Guanine deaminase [Alphaproteobacteria bacterium MarineAlpha5_Bin8]|nr:MAG: Guanine deaminase [Alphaproteobacteria bacterium MarineAlpha5_Bin8]PPR45923.1 MAG: Guanine deaminase [Alphaproteobacteria bacterium MarineAlpha5_Bin7]PPR54081.1 MAG: Guanine deaminase [Alphaproteobacteria bacterium MarineAlpha5_Bin6]|tara:strand:- start:618 stop:1091 length:474 start_codon:yes stop_codon:yes gene_type:complete
MENNKKKFMLRAIELSLISVNEQGGPFGCVIVKNDNIIAEGSNQVTRNNDPTAHAEIVTIRNACKNLNTFDLKGTEMFTSCEPCPMCLSAIYWAHIDKIYYGNTRVDAAKIGFDDNFIYDELVLDINKRKIPLEQINQKEAIVAFNNWDLKLDKIKY